MNLIEVDRSLRELRLGGMAAALEARIREAQTENLPHLDLLFGSAPLSLEVLEVEVVAHSVTWSPSTTPVRLRRPIVVTFGHGPSAPVRPLSNRPSRPRVRT